MRTVIALSELTKRYGKRADAVLADYLRPLPREKGQQRSYEIVVPLPNYEHFIRMQAAMFRSPLEKQIQIAKEEFDWLALEMEEWFNGLPAGFQQAEHGQQILTCWNEMQSVVASGPNVPKNLADVQVVYVPPDNPDGRPEKRDITVARLQACIDSLEEIEETVFSEVLKQWISQANTVKFPSMYA